MVNFPTYIINMKSLQFVGNVVLFFKPFLQNYKSKNLINIKYKQLVKLYNNAYLYVCFLFASFYIQFSPVRSHMHTLAHLIIISSISSPHLLSPSHYFIRSKFHYQSILLHGSLSISHSIFVLVSSPSFIPSSISNCVVSMHLQVLLFLIDTKLDLVRITFTLNIWRLQSEEKKKCLSQLFTKFFPSINNQQYWKKNSCRFHYYPIPHPLSITITDSRYTKDWFMKQNSFSCVGRNDICILTKYPIQ